MKNYLIQSGSAHGRRQVLLFATRKNQVKFRSGTEPKLEVKGVEVKKIIIIKKIETPNKHSFNKPSTKKNTQNYYFLGYYNAIVMKIELTVLIYYMCEVY